MEAGGGGGRSPLQRTVAVLGQGLAALVGIVLLAGAGGILLATQTAAGRSVAADLLEGALQEAVEGRVEVGAVTGGNLFTRARLEGLTIRGPDDELFVAVRDVRVEYDPLRMLAGSYHLRRVRTGRMEVRLLQGDDGAWNFERIFGGDGEDDGQDGTRLFATDVSVADGRLEVRTPWEGGEDEMWVVERTERGAERVIALEDLSGRLPLVRLVDPDRPMRVEMEEVEARARAVRQPVEIATVEGAATFGDTIRVDLDRLRSGEGTALSARGRVIPADPPRHRFELEADRLAFADLGWLPLPVPAEGVGSGDLVLRSAEGDPEVLAVEVRDGDFRSGESRVTGDVAVRLRETPVFPVLDLRLRPLQLGLVHDLLETGGGPEGRVSGRVRGEGPADLLRLDADVSLRPADGDAPSGLRAEGGVGVLGEGARFDDLRVELTDFEPLWTRLAGVDTRQTGRIDGVATLGRAPDGRVSFSADLTHRVPGDSTSRVEGRGDIDPGAETVDVSLTADPLSLSLLDPFFPALDMVGVVRGPLSVSGGLSDLRADADLDTPRGHLAFDGRFDLASERKRYDATLSARGLQLRQWFRGAPASDLEVEGRVDGVGTDPATLRATFDLQVLPSSVHGARVDSSLLRFTVERGLARVDTFAIRSDAGVLRGRGGFGLASDRRAALLLGVEASDLSRWNRWISSPDGPERVIEEDDGVFSLFSDEEGGEDGNGLAAPDTLSGSLIARGAVFGNVQDFGVGGKLTARSVAWGDTRADSVNMVLDATDARSLDSLSLSGAIRGLAHDGQPLDSLLFRVQRTGARAGDVDLRAHRAGGSATAAAALDASDGRTVVDLRALDLRMGEQRLRLADTARLALGETGLSIDGLLLEGDRGERVRIDGAVPREGEADLTTVVEGVDLGNARRLLRLGPELGGRLQGRLRVQGTAADPRMEASLRVDEPRVGSHAYAALEGEARYAGRELELDTEIRSAAGRVLGVSGTVRSDLRLQEVERRLLDDPFDLRLVADSLPLGLVLAPVESVRDVEGHAVLDVGVTGSPEDLSLDGSGELRRAAFRLVPAGVRFREVRGRMTFRGSEVAVDSLTLASGAEGRGEVTGTVDLATPTDPAFDLEVRTQQLRVADRRRLTMLADGRGTLGGTYRQPTLTGEFRLSDGSARVDDFLGGNEAIDLTDPELLALVDTTGLAERRLMDRIQNPFVQNLRAQLTLQIGPDLWLRARNLDVELSGEVDLRMDRAQADVTVVGEVRLVRGNYRWSAAGEVIGRQLRISAGRIEFVGTPGMDPNLDITATHRVRSDMGSITVSVDITGTMTEPQLAISSEPPLSESDRMCVLLINSPCAAAGARGQLVAETVLGRVGTELTSALSGGGGPDYITVQSAAGARGHRQGGAGEEGAGDDAFLGDKELEIGWYLSPEVFLTLTQPFGRRTPAFSLDWRFSEAWTLELRSEHLLTQNLTRSASSNLDEQRLWGMFLFREWSF